MRMPLIMGAFSETAEFLPVDNPLLDSAEAQRRMQRLLADKINSYADVSELRLILVSGAQADGVVTQGLTPLHYACHRDYYAAAKLLLVRGAKINAVDDVGYSPLHLCAERGNYRLMKLLLQYMAKVCYVNPRDSKMAFPLRESVDEPLRMAVCNGHYECAHLLLENGADANARYFDGPEIAHVSPMNTHFLRLLLSHGADPNVHGRDGLTPLMKACRYKDKGVKAAQILLDHGADVNQLAMPKKDMRTALHYAVLSGSESMTEFLIKNGAAVNMPVHYAHPSPLDMAILRGDARLVELLLRAGADANRIHGRMGSALHVACCRAGSSETLYEVVDLLLRYGADPNLCASFASSTGPADASEEMSDDAAPAVNGNASSDVTYQSHLKSPLVEFLRCVGNEVPDYNVFRLLLSYGGRILLVHVDGDPRCQLRNLVTLVDRAPHVASLMLALAEHVDGEHLARVIKYLTRNVAINVDGRPAEALEYVLDFIRKPRSLHHLTRLQVRQSVTICHGRLSPATVGSLPISAHEKQFVLGMFP